MWSAGVIMYIMLCGYPPFHGTNDRDVIQKVRLGTFQFAFEDWRDISADAKALIRGLLSYHPKDRLSADAGLNHSWLKRSLPKEREVFIKRGLIDNLRKFRSGNRLRKAALHIIASQLAEDKIEDLRDLFLTLDTNSDGQLTLQEMIVGIEKAGIKEVPPDLNQLLTAIDVQGTGAIDYTEWLAATLNKKHYMQENVCWAAFRVFDQDGDGKISQAELKAILETDEDVQRSLGGEMSAIEQIMLEVDTDGDGQIDFYEFMEMMRDKKADKKGGGE
jgi:calcium-dependent protein kinase